MSQKIKVVCRVRPVLLGEREADVNVTKTAHDTIHVQCPTKNTGHRFNFSAAYDGETSQEKFYEAEMKPKVDQLLRGECDVAVMAYGPSNSGKTYTCQGNVNNAGVVPRTLKALFEQGASVLSVSYMELWNDQCRDLFEKKETNLPIREHTGGKVFVAGLKRVLVSSFEEFELHYRPASERRATAATNLNNVSSRSHAILSVKVVDVNAQNVTSENDHVRTGSSASQLTQSTLTIVDLAGSENNKKTGNDAQRLKESTEINKSLLALRKVIEALNKGDLRIPYRDSKLTRLLSDALGGNALGVFVCNISPVKKHYNETLSALTFASLARNVENRPLERNDRKHKELPPKPDVIKPDVAKPDVTRPDGVKSTVSKATPAAPKTRKVRSATTLRRGNPLYQAPINRQSRGFSQVRQVQTRPENLPLKTIGNARQAYDVDVVTPTRRASSSGQVFEGVKDNCEREATGSDEHEHSDNARDTTETSFELSSSSSVSSILGQTSPEKPQNAPLSPLGSRMSREGDFESSSTLGQVLNRSFIRPSVQMREGILENVLAAQWSAMTDVLSKSDAPDALRQSLAESLVAIAKKAEESTKAHLSNIVEALVLYEQSMKVWPSPHVKSRIQDLMPLVPIFATDDLGRDIKRWSTNLSVRRVDSKTPSLSQDAGLAARRQKGALRWTKQILLGRHREQTA